MNKRLLYSDSQKVTLKFLMSQTGNRTEYIYGLSQTEFLEAFRQYRQEMVLSLNNFSKMKKFKKAQKLTNKFFEEETEENSKWLKDHRYFE